MLDKNGSRDFNEILIKCDGESHKSTNQTASKIRSRFKKNWQKNKNNLEHCRLRLYPN